MNDIFIDKIVIDIGVGKIIEEWLSQQNFDVYQFER